jgi:WD40 repeat protein
MAVQLWDLGEGVERRRLAGPRETLTCVALSPDARRVAAGTRGGTVHLWTLDPPNTPPRAVTPHVGPVGGVGFCPDGSAVLSGGRDGTLVRWDVETSRGERLMRGEAGPVRAVACARTTGAVAVAGEHLILRQPDGSALTLSGPEGGTHCVAFSPDGSLLVSGGADGAVRLWRTDDGVELAKFDGHSGPVRAVAISPDRRFVFSGGADGTLRRWPARVAPAARSESGGSRAS